MNDMLSPGNSQFRVRPPAHIFRERNGRAASEKGHHDHPIAFRERSVAPDGLNTCSDAKISLVRE